MKKARDLGTSRALKAATNAPHARHEGWAFLTNHAHVLLCLYQQSDRRLRDVASAVGITERMVQRVVAELAEAGYVQITKDGRCNRYAVNTTLDLRHPLELPHTIGELMKALSPRGPRRRA